ncbi:MAG TPA: ABC transporter substrate-binding protein [Actinomycetota bacterium]
MSNRAQTLRIAGAVLAGVMLLAACGQKKGVFQGGAGGFAVGPTGVPTGIDSGTGTGTGIGTGTGTGVGTGTGTGTGGGGGVTAAPDRTGITDDSITIGLHAPLTGAAPFSPAAFDEGKDLYWRWLQETKKKDIYGREVKLIFKDDQYNPSTAVAVCNQMAIQGQAFMLVGGGGTDQINSCANYANPRGIPYLSPGVQEAGLKELSTYFAVTMTYRQQMPMLVDMLVDQHKRHDLESYGAGTITVGHVRPNTPNFDDADDALRAAVKAAGWAYRVYTVVKEGDSQSAGSTAQIMQSDNVDIVVPITAPLFTVQLATATGQNRYFPTYAGVGITNNLNQMINSVCGKLADPPSFEGALFFSPWPGWKDVMTSTIDPDFVAAAQKYTPNTNTRDKGGDILYALWGISKAIHQALLAAGPDLSRQSFIQTLSAFRYTSGIFPVVNYATDRPFGAAGVHVLEGRCSEPGEGDAQAGAQYVSHPDYKGLRQGF